MTYQQKQPSKIKELAALMRDRCKLQQVLAPCMVSVLESMDHIWPGFKYEIVLDGQLPPDVEAEMDVPNKRLRIASSTSTDLNSGCPRARFTIAHELGHLWLNHEGANRRDRRSGMYVGDEKIMEREANEFASHFLVPTEMVAPEDDSISISTKFSISNSAAEIVYARVGRENRQQIGGKSVKRPLSDEQKLRLLALEQGSNVRHSTVTAEDRKRLADRIEPVLNDTDSGR